jgi:hypothetical protein
MINAKIDIAVSYIIFGCRVSMKSRMKIRKPAPTRTWMRAKMDMSR